VNRGVGAAIALVLGTVVAACGGHGTRYSSPEAAVIRTCHAAHIYGIYSFDHEAQIPANYTPGEIQVGWQKAGQRKGDGWVALAEKHDGGYRVSTCRWKIQTHG
jgi:hypothetical protein